MSERFEKHAARRDTARVRGPLSRQPGASRRCAQLALASALFVAAPAGASPLIPSSPVSLELASLAVETQSDSIILSQCTASCIDLPRGAEFAVEERHESRQPLRPDDIVLSSDVYVVWNGAEGVVTLVWDGGHGPRRVVWDHSMEFVEESSAFGETWVVDFTPTAPPDEYDPEAPYQVSAQNAIRMRTGSRASAPQMRLLIAGTGQVVDRTEKMPQPDQPFSEMPPELVWQPEESGLVALLTRVSRSKQTVAVLTLVLLWVMVRLAR